MKRIFTDIKKETNIWVSHFIHKYIHTCIHMYNMNAEILDISGMHAVWLIGREAHVRVQIPSKTKIICFFNMLVAFKFFWVQKSLLFFWFQCFHKSLLTVSARQIKSKLGMFRWRDDRMDTCSRIKAKNTLSDPLLTGRKRFMNKMNSEEVISVRVRRMNCQCMYIQICVRGDKKCFHRKNKLLACG